jgi:hypothetical protein
MKTAQSTAVRAFLLVCCLLAATACDEDTPTGPTVPLNQRFVLAPGGVAVVADTNISLQFVDVTGDSRCPADAVCIQGGDATVHMRILDSGETTGYELHTGDSRRASFTHRNLRVELRELQPYPFSSRTIDPSDYRATLVASRP